MFDVDSVRCGKNGNIYFGLDWKEYANVSPLQFYLFSDSSATMTKDSLWILDTEFAMESNCEKLNIPNLNLSNAFCLQKFEERENKKLVLNYRNSENEKKRGVYFIYSKYGFYKAFCNVKSNACELLFSCVIILSENMSCIVIKKGPLDRMNCLKGPYQPRSYCLGWRFSS